MYRTAWLTMLAAVVGAGGVLLIAGCGGGSGGDTWSVRQNAGVVEIAYGSGTNFPQYAALHLSSGYLRLIPSASSGWGTSVILMPALWSGGTYHQGAAITATPVRSGADLLIPFDGTIAGVTVHGTARISPPTAGEITAVVTVTTTGGAVLDGNRPGEACKPVMLSSMHISGTQWDSQSAFLDAQSYPFPLSGWIVPPTSSTKFGLLGGTSAWKTNAPTVEITLDQARTVTGWVEASADPNDDNVGLWAASDTVLSSWQYTITAKE